MMSQDEMFSHLKLLMVERAGQRQEATRTLSKSPDLPELLERGLVEFRTKCRGHPPRRRLLFLTNLAKQILYEIGWVRGYHGWRKRIGNEPYGLYLTSQQAEFFGECSWKLEGETLQPGSIIRRGYQALVVDQVGVPPRNQKKLMEALEKVGRIYTGNVHFVNTDGAPQGLPAVDYPFVVRFK